MLMNMFLFQVIQLNSSDFTHRTTFDTAFKKFVNAKRDGVHLSGGAGNSPVCICVTMFLVVDDVLSSILTFYLLIRILTNVIYVTMRADY